MQEVWQVLFPEGLGERGHRGLLREISYDKEADAIYIELRKGEFAKNKNVDGCTILDLDKEGNTLGIELLEVSKRFPQKSLFDVHVRNLVAIAH